MDKSKSSTAYDEVNREVTYYFVSDGKEGRNDGSVGDIVEQSGGRCCAMSPIYDRRVVKICLAVDSTRDVIERMIGRMKGSGFDFTGKLNTIQKKPLL